MRQITDYLLHIAVLVAIYALLAMSLDLVVGQSGMLSVAHAAFYGIGAYTAALLDVHTQIPFLISVALAAVVGACASLLISLTALRVRGELFVIATFSVHVLVWCIMNNAISFTRGPLGIAGIRRPSLLGFTFDEKWQIALLMVGICLAGCWILGRIAGSPFGRVLRAIREDEQVAEAGGKCVGRFKIAAFGVSSGFAAVAGALYASYTTYVDPTSFTIMESVLVLTMVIVGGAGSIWGPVIGAAVLVCLPESLRFLGLPTAQAAHIRYIIYGAMLVIMMVVRPQGLVGVYAFERPEGRGP